MTVFKGGKSQCDYSILFLILVIHTLNIFKTVIIFVYLFNIIKIKIMTKFVVIKRLYITLNFSFVHNN